MSLRLGSFPVVVSSSVAAAARSILKTPRPGVHRPSEDGVGQVHRLQLHSDVLWAPYGAYWRQARRLCKTEIFSARRLRSQERVRDEELQAMLHDLYVHGTSSATAAAAGRVVVVLDHLLMANVPQHDLTHGTVLGKKYVVDDDDDDETGCKIHHLIK